MRSAAAVDAKPEHQQDSIAAPIAVAATLDIAAAFDVVAVAVPAHASHAVVPLKPLHVRQTL